jgi:tetratricopeptide (TPR) repeat protein
MAFRSKKPRSLAEIPRRWDATPPKNLPDLDVPGRPTVFISVLIAFLCIAMISAVVMLYRSGTMSPSTASAAAPDRPPANEAITTVLNSARKLMGQSEWPKAETVLRRAAMQFPEQQEVRTALAETLLAMDKPKDSYEQYEKALAIGPREAKLEFAAGQVASKAGLTDRAEEHFAMAQTADPKNPACPLMLGMVQRKLGKIESAKASLVRSCRMDPDNAFAWGTLADIALGENHLDLCLQHIEKARALQPENKEWRLIEARALKRKGDPTGALRILTALDVSQKREPAVARQIAECFSMLGRHAEAASALAEAAVADAVNADLAYDAATAFERAGNRTRALEFATQAQILGNANAGRMIERLKQQ